MKEVDLTIGEAIAVCRARGWDVQPWNFTDLFVCGKPDHGLIEAVAMGTSYTKAVENAIRATKPKAIEG